MTVALGTSLLTFVPRFTAVVTGLQWERLHQVLGGAADEAGVLVRLFTATGAVLVGAAAWGWVAPGFLPLGALMVVAAISTGWERTPMNTWIPSSAGKTLFNSAKGAAVALGIQLGGFTFGAAALSAIAASQKGADPATVAGLVQAAYRWLFVLAVGIAAAKLGWAFGVRAFRIAPISVLVKFLPVEHAGAIIGKLLKAGYGDVGILRAVFLDPARKGRINLQKPLTKVLAKNERKMLREALRA